MNCDVLALEDCEQAAGVATSAASKAAEEIKQIRILPRPPSGKKWVISYGEWVPPPDCRERKLFDAPGLYGANPKYTQGMLRNAKLAKTVFAGWTVWVYVDRTVPASIKQALQQEGAELKEVAEEEKRTSNLGGGIGGMFWRFLAIDDAGVERFIVRDADSRLNRRERFAVEEWVRSGRAVHTIRDHPSHDRHLNGGLWGAVHGFLGPTTTMRSLMQQWKKKGKYGADLDFLNDVIWPRLQDTRSSTVMAHDSVTCTKHSGSVPFPTQRDEDYQHVGQVFLLGKGGADQARAEDIDGFLRCRPVPRACRAKAEWLYG